MQASSSRLTRRFVIVLLLSLSLACNLLSGLRQNLNDVKSTANALATEAKGGREVIATAQAMITQVADNQLLETAKAIATEISQSGAVETLQAMVSEQAPGVEETLQAFMTQEAPSLEETARALLTQVPSLSASPPEDIPLVESEKENLVITKETISYMVAMPFSEVVAFYKREMPQKGWSYQQDQSKELGNSSLLIYTKQNRSASISINYNPLNQKTIILIILQNP